MEITSSESQGGFNVPIKLGMEFDSDEQAYECYIEYAAALGFSVRKEYANKNKVQGYVTSRKFTCHKEGYRSKDKRGQTVQKHRKETRTGCLAHIIISRQSDGKFRITSFQEKHNHPLDPSSLSHILPSQRKIKVAQAHEVTARFMEITYSESQGGFNVPIKLGMEFDSDEHAYEWYNEYAAAMGFSARKEYANKSKVQGYVTSRKFTCHKEGYRSKDKRDRTVQKHRKETRTGCLAHIIISRQSNGTFRITSFEEKHNHPLDPSLSDMLPSERKIKVAQAHKVSVRYKHLCEIFAQISSEASESKEGYELAAKCANELVAKLKHVKKRNESHEDSAPSKSIENELNETIFIDNTNATKLTGLKRKQPTHRSNTRTMSFMEMTKSKNNTSLLKSPQCQTDKKLDHLPSLLSCQVTCPSLSDASMTMGVPEGSCLKDHPMKV
ncbi:protein FAR1-RELATED SEQUENCE 7-like isoform X2 [Nicotiana tabacum]|uniref:Protein FAR1-RELATED SEQUENCE 7-like isoform X2 n=2 Tax=Nicotiana TaxID=4085 RepID=A0A1S3Z8M5_TOBAC|nr:PREDICTED: protein FAR1-RELATED SEQUENCE 7-like [Nicotiana sylvestris]XP_009765928.1 PREDICTED: protein FAR1-RELATED SEQUENCE 7-like [Nicotiana sylvestris]XP_016460557.1 PREDICTED: protein FAR1-RELATED SEQUENCE 7-like isoform X2 [Nicotiana tabacum]